MPPVQPSIADLAAGVVGGDRAMLGRSITLVESTRAGDRSRAQELLATLGPRDNTHRVGITGVPGVGKSTFIDELGSHLTDLDHRVAVLAVDPTSSRTGGSILGDKTRMTRLAVDRDAFIRPSPTAGTLGGVARRTRESIVVVEAAGYDVVLVETVGVGQSETVVAGMVDVFLVLMLPGAGDELQGIKKGILEIADLIAVNKSDGDNVERARSAARDYSSALRLLEPASPNWNPNVVTCSGLTGNGVAELWQQLQLHRAKSTESGEFAQRRKGQRVRWMWDAFKDELVERALGDERVGSLVSEVEAAVLEGSEPPGRAASRLLDTFFGN
ncbi:MAG: methylmalonyl Co-A mutase-associated GTPase MeaB [Actinomycetia bacterium]|nr:methylmalonyl Co-A mutase-associated GTPase MeaB [Actinomycetes bacterium]